MAENNIDIQCIVGLGNPGAEYEATRHNAGAWFALCLAHTHHAEMRVEKKFHGLYSKVQINGKPCHILIPNTFMNCSGQAVQALMKFYKLTPKQILVAHDELDLEPGIAKFKLDGGHAGHNGLRDIISKISTKEFVRLRLGIGHPGNRDRVHDYVLHAPTSSDRDKIMIAIERASEQMPHILDGDLDKATRQLHTLCEE